MTVKEKANAYDKALEKLQDAFTPREDGRKISGLTREYIENIFPELKVSDGERIVKCLLNYFNHIRYSGIDLKGTDVDEVITWLEKQRGCETDCPHNHQDENHPNGSIELEDFTGGEGFYKIHLDYLNKRVDEIEEMIRVWNKNSKVPEENIKACIGMCLTDASGQRFKDYNTSVKDCLAWLEKQGEKKGYTFKSIPRLLDMIKPSETAKLYCQKLIDSLTKEGYDADAKIVANRLLQMNEEEVAMVTMDRGEKQGKELDPELKESERIRKCVRYAVDKLFLKESVVCDVHKEDVLAWLENQGEQKPTWKPTAAQLIVIKSLMEDKNTSNANKTVLRGMFEEFKEILNNHTPNNHTPKFMVGDRV